MIQKLPEAPFRVDTGAVQFGADWPGVFFRGDNAAGISDRLRMIAQKTDGPYRTYLLDLAKSFSACHVEEQAA